MQGRLEDRDGQFAPLLGRGVTAERPARRERIFITGSKDIEKEWDAYVKGFEGLSIARYLEIHQKAIDAKS